MVQYNAIKRSERKVAYNKNIHNKSSKFLGNNRNTDALNC